MSGDTMASSLARRLLRMLAEQEQQERAKRIAAARRVADVKPPPETSIYDGVSPFQQEHEQ